LIPKLPAYIDDNGKTIDQIKGGISITQIKEDFVHQPIPSPQALVPSSNLDQTMSTNISQSSPANTAESMIESLLNPKILLASAIDQIRNSTSNGNNNLENKNYTSGLFAYHKTLLLGRQIIPPKDYILLFDAPSEISNGQISAKLPCDVNYTSPLKLFVVRTNSGLKIETRLVDLQVINSLSRAGYTCVYNAPLPNSTSIPHKAVNYSVKNNRSSIDSGLDPEKTINNVGLLNPTSYQQVLTPTSSIALGFDKAHSTASLRK
jgi:hypothetical protein